MTPQNTLSIKHLLFLTVSYYKSRDLMTHGVAYLMFDPLENLIWQLPILPYEYPWILTYKKCIRGRKLPSIHEE